MNEHDSEKMASLLDKAGYVPVSGPAAADVYVINTCSIREKAEHKVYSALGKLKALKAHRPGMVAVVAGCVAQQEQDRLLKRVGYLDAVLGTHHIADLPEIVAAVRERRDRISRIAFSDDVQSLHIPAPRKGTSPVCSFISIMQGCSNFCTYCVVPFTRGPEQSRLADEIVDEVKRLADSGVREISLLGQNVNAYGKDLDNGSSFPLLLRRLDTIPGLARIRFTTSHPRDFDRHLIDAMADLGTVCEHIHLPLQSGSNRILKAMNRGYTREAYLEGLSALRERIPRVAITTDIIVGFPGETDEDFEETLQVLATIRYDQIFSFKFSPRPGTAALRLKGHIPEDVKSERLARVHELQENITLAYHRGAEGTVEEILVEGKTEKTGQFFGRTRTNKIVNLEPGELAEVGQLVRATILRGLRHSLTGRIAPVTDQHS
jgi:tRNA-2-methylthio-N6-dimethylallyladenosine synthase